MSGFLPLNRDEASRRGWNELDIVLVTGDAYVDHPAFGAAVIGRVLERNGYRVGIIAMPEWRNPESIRAFGRPRLFFGVTSGNVDSMLARYTAFKKVRNDDPYAPGGVGGSKPERALIVYCNLIRAGYKDIPIVLGGIEASMRRMAHYDFFGGTLRRTILEDARADILAYGMAEAAVVEIADRLASGQGLDGIPGTVVMTRQAPAGALMLPAQEDVIASSAAFLEFSRLSYQSQDRVMAQPCGKRFLVQYPPPETNALKLEETYTLPYSYAPHPMYTLPIPAYEMIKDSITAHRGCVSGCSFCSVALHQGRRIVARKPDDILAEIGHRAGFSRGVFSLTDIGGPSANMYGYECRNRWHCPRESCTFPQLCPNLVIKTRPWIDLLDQAAQLKGVKRVTIGSGVRYDLIMRDSDSRAVVQALCERHVSGQLKIAPEHTVPEVLAAMRKTPAASLEEFVDLFRTTARRSAGRVYLLPYLMSCHPGCTMAHMQSMRREVMRVFGFIPQQVQAFIPLPMTLSSVIYATGIDPLTTERIAVERDPRKRRRQHEVFFSDRRS